MEEKDGEELGSIFGSIISSFDKGEENFAGLAAGNDETMEAGKSDISSDSESGVAFEDTISEVTEIQAAEANGSTEKAADSENVSGKAFSTENKDADEVKPFRPKKMSAKEAMSGKKKPQALNKQLILYLIVGVTVFAVMFAVIIFPFLTKKRDKGVNEKPIASENHVTDYSKLVESYGKEKIQSEEYPSQERQTKEADEKILASLPPVNEKYRPKEEAQIQSVYYSSGSSYSYEVPDTRSDSLQSKTINDRAVCYRRRHKIPVPYLQGQRAG